jgi:hypothetical protein
MSEWILRPGQLMAGDGAGFGVWQGGRLHDGERGSRMFGMNAPGSGHLCPHKLNAVNCLQCFHAKAAAAPTSQLKPRSPQRADNPVLVAINERAGIGTARGTPAVPHVDAPVHVGVNPDGTRIEPTRGPMPKPVVHATGAQVGRGVTAAPAFSYANETGRIDSKGVWHPPKRRQLIDSLPRHPEADKR